MPQTISILGSTGSIGAQTLDVIRHFPEKFQVAGLAAGLNIRLLAAQVAEFKPFHVTVQREEDIPELAALLKQLNVLDMPKIHAGTKSLAALAGEVKSDVVVVGLVGLTGLAPTLAALKSGKKVLTANKETFVAGGHLVHDYLSQIIPLDSEHSAIFQCLAGNTNQQSIERILLTASGGPFRTWSASQIQQATVEDALKHPNWVMGKKVTVDSATLMNKGLEVIEAHWLFGIGYDQIDVVIHPQSIIHSGVQFVDGALLFQAGAPDMRGPIQYGMFYPNRVETPFSACRLDVKSLTQLNFEQPDHERFPCLSLAYEAGRIGGGMTTVLNAADEVLVEKFLAGEIGLLEISRSIESVMSQYQLEGVIPNPTLQEIQAVDDWVREYLAQANTTKQFQVI